MAKKSVIIRQSKREKCVEKFWKVRQDIKKAMKSPTVSDKEKWDLQKKIQALPRNSSITRLRNRCFITGRPRGVYQILGVSRAYVRSSIMNGYCPGFKKDSW